MIWQEFLFWAALTLAMLACAIYLLVVGYLGSRRSLANPRMVEPMLPPRLTQTDVDLSEIEARAEIGLPLIPDRLKERYPTLAWLRPDADVAKAKYALEQATHPEVLRPRLYYEGAERTTERLESNMRMASGLTGAFGHPYATNCRCVDCYRRRHPATGYGLSAPTIHTTSTKVLSEKAKMEHSCFDACPCERCRWKRTIDFVPLMTLNEKEG